ncbi:hypothetical protein GNZ11_29065 [Paraburkholderia xenovorans]|nr:hypothetical protein [Paraburkholderia xenovorans]
MTPLNTLDGSHDGIALACGFFEFRSDLGEAITACCPITSSRVTTTRR